MVKLTILYLGGSRSRSNSPNNYGRSSSSFSRNSEEAIDPVLSQQQLQQQLFYDQNQRNKCVDESVSSEQLLMLGMYRLNPEQEKIYQNFVNMLSSFETIDMVRSQVSNICQNIKTLRLHIHNI